MKKLFNNLLSVLLLIFITIVTFSCEKEEFLPLVEEVPVESIETPPTVSETVPPPTENVKFEGGEYLNVHEYLSTPIDGAELIVPVVIINYIPSNDGKTITDEFAESGGVRDWAEKVNYGMSVGTVRTFFLHGDIRQKWSMEEGSRYHGQEDPTAKPYLGFKVLKDINIYKMDFNSSGKIDYFKLFDKINLKELVETHGVKEVWFNCIPHNYTVPESNMSSPHKLFKRHDGYVTSDVSNSYREDNDLPIYNKTFVVYGNNGFYANNIHNHGHQIEAQLSIWEVYRNQYDLAYLFFQKWGGYPEGKAAPYYRGGRVGLVHSPPNAEVDYDYQNETFIESDILDWRPDRSGTKKLINKNAWHYERTMPVYLPAITEHQKWSSWGSNSNKVGGDPHGGWLIYWMQSIPSKNNNIPYTFNGTNYTITNWWDIIYKCDETITNNKNLFE